MALLGRGEGGRLAGRGEGGVGKGSVANLELPLANQPSPVSDLVLGVADEVDKLPFKFNPRQLALSVRPRPLCQVLIP